MFSPSHWTSTCLLSIMFSALCYFWIYHIDLHNDEILEVQFKNTWLIEQQLNNINNTSEY